MATFSQDATSKFLWFSSDSNLNPFKYSLNKSISKITSKSRIALPIVHNVKKRNSLYIYTLYTFVYLLTWGRRKKGERKNTDTDLIQGNNATGINNNLTVDQVPKKSTKTIAKRFI